jgi:transposase
MGGRPPLDDRRVLKGIVFVLRTGIPWTSLPKAMGCGSGMTCWRRLRDWQAAGVWTRLHQILLDRLGRANAVDFSRCSLDSASFPAKRGTSAPARTRPTAGSPEPSATCSWKRTASRSRFCSAQRTPTTRGAARSAVRRAAPQAPGQAARRQRIRLRPLPPVRPPAEQPAPDRAARGGQRRTPGPAQVGG